MVMVVVLVEMEEVAKAKQAALLMFISLKIKEVQRLFKFAFESQVNSHWIFKHYL